MEFMIAYYPAFKFATYLLILTVAVILYRSKLYKSATGWIILWSIIGYLSPIKIDGTESHKAHSHEVAEATAQHRIVSTMPRPAKTHNPTFSERMEAEKARSNLANKDIQDEL